MGDVGRRKEGRSFGVRQEFQKKIHCADREGPAGRNRISKPQKRGSTRRPAFPAGVMAGGEALRQEA